MSSNRTLATDTVTTLTGTANAAALGDNTYLGVIKGGTATMMIKIKEVVAGGQEPTTSKPVVMVGAFDSTVAVTPTGGTAVDSADNPNFNPATALAVVGNGFTTKPQRSANRIFSQSFNAYGGNMKQPFQPGEEPILYGQAVNIGEVSVSAFTGTTTGALVGGHIKYEIL